MEFIFFKCEDYSGLDERIKTFFDISQEHQDIKAQGYSGPAANYQNFNLNPIKLKSRPNRSSPIETYDFIDPDEQAPLTDDAWKFLKKLKKLPDDLPQSRAKLEELGILPFRYITRQEKTVKRNKGLWEGLEPEPKPVCQMKNINMFYALILDTTKNVVVGRARAHPVTPSELEQETGKMSQFKGLPKDIKYMYISRVDINPLYRGQKICDKLVSFMISKLSEAKPECDHFVIYNASRTADGIPACRCYVKSGIQSGFTVHEEQWEKQFPDGTWGEGLNEMTLDKCIGTSKQMPDIYFYVRNPTKGGKKKKRNKTRKAKSKAKPNTRKAKAKPNTRKAKNKK